MSGETERMLLGTTDAMIWAEEFCRMFKGCTITDRPQDVHGIVDQGGMVAWFASAIETGRSAGRGQVVLAQTNDDRTISLMTDLNMERDVSITPQLLVQMIERYNESLSDEQPTVYDAARRVIALWNIRAPLDDLGAAVEALTEVVDGDRPEDGFA